MLDSSGVLISICEDPGKCPICQGQWHVQKTTPHHGRTISHGQFEIRETIHVCANRCRLDSGKLVTRRANSLARHILPGKTVGYDVMTLVGLQRFVHHRQREEIRELVLHEHGIPLSSGSISNLAKLFLGYLWKLHVKHIEPLHDALNADGGWPLHIDLLVRMVAEHCWWLWPDGVDGCSVRGKYQPSIPRRFCRACTRWFNNLAPHARLCGISAVR